MLTVVVDPGHGGDDPGAINPNEIYTEADFNWQCAQVVKLAMESHGWKVILTRQEDENPHEGTSAGLANSIGADYFISIHANGATPAAHGAECLYYYGSERGKALARTFMANYASVTGFKDRGIKPRYPRDIPGKKPEEYRGSVVLGRTTMPAILVEAGFITNPLDYQKLFKMRTMGAVADAIIAAIVTMEKEV